MANLGSSDTPIKGQDFELPAGAKLAEVNGDLAIVDSNGNPLLRRDETAGEWNLEGTELTNIGSVDTENLQDATDGQAWETLREAGYELGDVVPIATYSSFDLQVTMASTSYTGHPQFSSFMVPFGDMSDGTVQLAVNVSVNIKAGTDETGYLRAYNNLDNEVIGAEVSGSGYLSSGWADYTPTTLDTASCRFQYKTDPGSNSSQFAGPTLSIGVRL